jgi:hypothetical protein
MQPRKRYCLKYASKRIEGSGGGGRRIGDEMKDPAVSSTYVHYLSIHVHIHERIRNIRNYISTLTLINVAPVHGAFALKVLTIDQ